MNNLLWALLFVSFNIFAAPIDINKASTQEISESLSGIGLKKAADIVAYRKENGSFTSIDDLANVKGIGEKTIAKNKENLLLTTGEKKKKNNLQSPK